MSPPEPFQFSPHRRLRVLVTGAGGFIASHLARRLKAQGHYVVAADWKRNAFFEEPEFCDEFFLVDLRVPANCETVIAGCTHIFHLAADMGGMGFITTNHSQIMYNNTMIDFNMLEAARAAGCVERFFYASSACIYPEFRQTDAEGHVALREDDAWPAQPQDAYGLQKLVTEQMCIHYAREFGLETRIARFHNIYGPHGTWTGGREKAPAAFCRKVAVAAVDPGPAAVDHCLEIWGDGKQTRSFTFIDDAVEGILRITASDYRQPLNLGSSEMVSMNAMMDLVKSFEEALRHATTTHVPGPEGVRGRNSDNARITEAIGWSPRTPLAEGLRKTYAWVKRQVQADGARGTNIYVAHAKSRVVQTQAPKPLGHVCSSPPPAASAPA